MAGNSTVSKRGSIAILSVFVVSLMLLSALGVLCVEGDSNKTETAEDTILISYEEGEELQGLDKYFDINVDTQKKIASIVITNLDVIVEADKGLVIDFEDKNYSVDLTFVGNNRIVTSPTSKVTNSAAIEIYSDNETHIHGDGTSIPTITVNATDAESTSSSYSTGIRIQSYRTVTIENCNIVATAGSSTTTVNKDTGTITGYSFSYALYTSVTQSGYSVNVSNCEMELTAGASKLLVNNTSAEAKKTISRVTSESIGLWVQNAPLTISDSKIQAKSMASEVEFNSQLTQSEHNSRCYSMGIATYGDDVSISNSVITSESNKASAKFTGKGEPIEPKSAKPLIIASIGMDFGAINISDSIMTSCGDATSFNVDSEKVKEMSAGMKFGSYDLTNATNTINRSNLALTLTDDAHGDNAFCLVEMIQEGSFEGFVVDRTDVMMYSRNGWAAASYNVDGEKGYESLVMDPEHAINIVDENGNPVTDTRTVKGMRVVYNYIITFNPGEHGQGSMDPIVWENTVEIMPHCDFKSVGKYRFIGWADAFGNFYTYDNPIKDVEDVKDGTLELTAVWESTVIPEPPASDIGPIIVAIVILIIVILIGMICVLYANRDKH